MWPWKAETYRTLRLEIPLPATLPVPDGAPIRDLELVMDEGAGKRDPGIREIGFGMAEVGPDVECFAGCFSAVVEFIVDSD